MNGDGTLRHRYLYGTLGHSPDLLMRGDTAYRVITDHLGSVRAVVRTSDGVTVAARLLRARWIVPCHYGTFPALTGTADALRDELAKAGVTAEVVTPKPGESVR